VAFDNNNLVHFHSLFVDTTLLDHRTYNQGNSEIGLAAQNRDAFLGCPPDAREVGHGQALSDGRFGG
jgi:hypothetical protein